MRERLCAGRVRVGGEERAVLVVVEDGGGERVEADHVCDLAALWVLDDVGIDDALLCQEPVAELGRRELWRDRELLEEGVELRAASVAVRLAQGAEAARLRGGRG